MLLLQVGAGLQRFPCKSEDFQTKLLLFLLRNRSRLFCLPLFHAELWPRGRSSTTWLNDMIQQNVTPCPDTFIVLPHAAPSLPPHSKGHGHGTLISPYPLHPPDRHTLTPPRLPVFALAVHGTSVSTCHRGLQPALTRSPPSSVLKGEPRVPSTL